MPHWLQRAEWAFRYAVPMAVSDLSFLSTLLFSFSRLICRMDKRSVDEELPVYDLANLAAIYDTLAE